MKSIGKLREYADKIRAYPGVMTMGHTATTIDAIADEIESEIANRYMPLPLDADGVPIQLGDTVREVDDRVPMKVTSLTFYEDCVDVNTCGMNPNLLYHVKPRTIEDVLDDYRRELVETWAYTLDDEMTDAEDEITARYADELRGMK